jgi:hypothetical protein
MFYLPPPNYLPHITLPKPSLAKHFFTIFALIFFTANPISQRPDPIQI